MAKKPFIYRSTIWNSVGGGFSNPGESRLCKVGAYTVLVSRSERLNKYGNPVHTATVVKKDGSMGASYRSDGSLTGIVSKVLEKSGVETRYRRK